MTTTWDPARPSDVCNALVSLAKYCQGASTSCACYSGAYYVPDQWNSLAAGCAQATSACGSGLYTNGTASNNTNAELCSYASQAASAVSYCPASTAAVPFAASIVTTDTSVGFPTATAKSSSTYDMMAPTATSTSSSSAVSSGATRGAANGSIAWAGLAIAMLGCHLLVG
jgi:hypothetical protein